MKKFLFTFYTFVFAVCSFGAKKLPEVMMINLVPLQPQYFDEIATDMRDVEKRGTCTMHVIQMFTVPEGAGKPVDKLADFIPQYKDLFARAGDLKLPVGLMIHAIMGHGSVTDYADIQRVVSVKGKERRGVYCPLDKNLLSYTADVARRMASLKPDFLLIDDDTRLTTSHWGCACPLHMKRLEKKLGRDISREELLARLNGRSPEDKRVAQAFEENNRESLFEMFKVIRATIDSVDPKMPVLFCHCAEDTRHSSEICKIIAGEDARTVCRINNARYWFQGESNRTFPVWAFKTAAQIDIIKDVDVKLAEVDSYYRNRYSTSARVLHSQYATSVLLGCDGAKFWPNSFTGWEPKSAKVYKDLFQKYTGFYKALREVRKSYKFEGVTEPLCDDKYFSYNPMKLMHEKCSSWTGDVIGRMGLPITYAHASEDAKVFMLDGKNTPFLSNSELKEILSKGAICDAKAALEIQRRGMGNLLGAKVKERVVSGESFVEYITDEMNAGQYANARCSSDGRFALEDVSPKARVLANLVKLDYIYAAKKSAMKIFCPSAIFFENELGGKVAVFAGETGNKPQFMCEARKDLYARVLNTINPLDAYYAGDAEVYAQAGESSDGDVVLYLVNIGLDTEEKVAVKFKRDISKAYVLLPNGEWEKVKFSRNGGEIIIDYPLETMLPAVFKLK